MGLYTGQLWSLADYNALELYGTSMLIGAIHEVREEG